MPMNGLPGGVTRPPAPLTQGQMKPGAMEERKRRPVGTLVLVFVFLAAFILYYFVNWKLLSGVWRIG
jgi:hypothetical protein